MGSVLWAPDHLEADRDWRGVTSDPEQLGIPESSQDTSYQMDHADTSLNGEMPEHRSLVVGL